MPDLQTTLDRLRRLAPEARSFEFAITPLDVTGVPVWSVTQWQEDGEMINGIGYGPSDTRALVGTWAELLEQTAAHRAGAALQRRVASLHGLRAEGLDAVDPRRLRLPAGTAWDEHRELTWVKVRRHVDGVAWADQPEAWIPVEAAVTHTYDLRLAEGERPLYQPVSNGNGAGDTYERALGHGLLELVQRDGNSAGYRALDRGIRVDLDRVEDPISRNLLTTLDKLGIEVIVKLADTNLGMTNLYVVGHERDPAACPHPVMLSGCGEAAHPDREAALQKALLEFCASRVRKFFSHGPLDRMEHLFPDGYLAAFRANPATVEESRSFEGVRDLVNLTAEETMALLEPTIFRVEATVRFSELPTVEPARVDTPEKLLDEVLARYAAEGLDVFHLDCLPDGPTGLAACKAIVPEMEVETVTYHRIGARNLDRLVGRGSDLAGYGRPPAGARPVPLPDGRDAWLATPKLDERMEPLYALYREPEVHAIALAEEPS
ncbi:YcaO-like family protein [Phycisphaera mikurensis]|uniref:YcaO domain-containing protein n=1 Tax=Phycisphaera mikurensis (strain NBRC 102666 / KCTC 22515 / FYK2301M01) TaxID=1142394 RepID=I0IFM9_PHYMF|nr:YcaO-like family protein [Phycisphaera mikurensis]MBB6440543.1 ribosomal protein S12 methylthiotransferase accessory factor [Phycisphaera mikurensis]BAM04067.1 hypothetical protein PSMK_19080 [Phycisphaera mikurensis NBRC 102666]